MDTIFQGQLLRPDFPFEAEVQTESSCLYHWHDAVELLLVGQGTICVAMPGREYQLAEDDLLLIGSGEVHCLTSEAGACWVSVRFAPRMVQPLLVDGGPAQGRELWPREIQRCSRQWQEQTAQQFRSLVRQLVEETEVRSHGWQTAVRGVLYQLSLLVLRELPACEENMARRDSRDDLLKKALAFLADNYTQDISLKECADVIGFNMNYFSRFFRSHTGIHFHQYLTELRLRKACQLLLTTGLPVTEVIVQSGFQNAKTFNRVFKNACGCSPRDYRKDSGTDRKL